MGEIAKMRLIHPYMECKKELSRQNACTEQEQSEVALGLMKINAIQELTKTLDKKGQSSANRRYY